MSTADPSHTSISWYSHRLRSVHAVPSLGAPVGRSDDVRSSPTAPGPAAPPSWARLLRPDGKARADLIAELAVGCSDGWPGKPRPLLLVAEDSLATIAAARWAARAARHQELEVAVLVVVFSAASRRPVPQLDDARAVVARVLPILAAQDVRGHELIQLGRGSDTPRARVRVIARSADSLRSPLIVMGSGPDRTLAAALCRAVPVDTLVIPVGALGAGAREPPP